MTVSYLCLGVNQHSENIVNALIFNQILLIDKDWRVHVKVASEFQHMGSRAIFTRRMP